LYYSVFDLDNQFNQRRRIMTPKPASVSCDDCESDRNSEWEEEENECEPEPACCWKTVISLYFFAHRIGRHNKQRTLNLKLALFHQKH